MPATILCVEDDPLVREVTQLSLERGGYDVITAASGEEALQRFRRHDIDLVLLDWVMPGMDGHEIVESLRGLRPDVKILLTSGYAHVATIPLIARREVEGFLQKPYLPSQLLRKVHQVLSMQHRRAARAG